jgi:hypothetical protein
MHKESPSQTHIVRSNDLRHIQPQKKMVILEIIVCQGFWITEFVDEIEEREGEEEKKQKDGTSLKKFFFPNHDSKK